MSRPNPVKGPAMRVPRPSQPLTKRSVQSTKAGSSSSGKDNEYLYLAGIRDSSNRIAEYRTESDICPACRSDRQFKKDLRLLVSPCYHKMCTSCIDRLFALGPSPCPQCGRILRKVNFAHQTFEDLKVEKEVSVRRRIAEQYNKRREDFNSDREYDDYLEEVEDITYNLLNDIDVEETERRITEFARKNAKLLEANHRKAEEEHAVEAEREELERQAKEERRRLIQEYEAEEEREAARVKAEIVDALALGAKDRAREIQRAANEAKALRARNLEMAMPAALLPTQSEAAEVDDTEHEPTSPSYAGPFVPFTVSDPDKAIWKGWYTLLDDYSDARSGSLQAKRDHNNMYRGGGFDLKQYWEMEIRAAIEGLGIDPME